MSEAVDRLREIVAHAERYAPHITVELTPQGLRLRGRRHWGITVLQCDHMASLDELDLARINTIIPAIDRIAASLELEPARQ